MMFGASLRPVAVGVTFSALASFPRPGDPCRVFISEAGRSWRMVYSNQLQATHSNDESTHIGDGAYQKVTASAGWWSTHRNLTAPYSATIDYASCLPTPELRSSTESLCRHVS